MMMQQNVDAHEVSFSSLLLRGNIYVHILYYTLIIRSNTIDIKCVYINTYNMYVLRSFHSGGRTVASACFGLLVDYNY